MVVTRVVKGTFNIRAKQAAGGWLLETACAIVEQARTAGALAIVNDRADIACLAGAHGVHVGQNDLSPAAARGIVGGESIVGLSTHTGEQIDLALRALIGQHGHDPPGVNIEIVLGERQRGEVFHQRRPEPIDEIGQIVGKVEPVGHQRPFAAFTL